jgi:hypothetical protein
MFKDWLDYQVAVHLCYYHLWMQYAQWVTSAIPS